MRFRNIVFILLISIVFTGCGSCEQAPSKNDKPVNSTPSNTDNSQTSNINGNDNINNNQPTPIPSAEVAAPEKPRVTAVTLKPVIDAFCAAMRNGDNVGLQKVYSKAAFKAIQAEMRKEGIATISEYLESEAVGNKCEVVNEDIQGNNAVAIVITETYEDGTPFKFVKENNEWKLTNESDAIDRVDQN